MRILHIVLKFVAATVGVVAILGSIVLLLGGASVMLMGFSVALEGTEKYPQWSALILLPAGVIPLLVGYLLFDLAKDMYHVIKGNV